MREQTHFQQALRTCGYSECAFVQTQTSLTWLLSLKSTRGFVQTTSFWYFTNLATH